MKPPIHETLYDTQLLSIPGVCLPETNHKNPSKSQGFEMQQTVHSFPSLNCPKMKFFGLNEWWMSHLKCYISISWASGEKKRGSRLRFAGGTTVLELAHKTDHMGRNCLPVAKALITRWRRGIQAVKMNMPPNVIHTLALLRGQHRC